MSCSFRALIAENQMNKRLKYPLHPLSFAGKRTQKPIASFENPYEEADYAQDAEIEEEQEQLGWDMDDMRSSAASDKGEKRMLSNAEFTMISESFRNQMFENGLKISLLCDIMKVHFHYILI